MIKIWITKEGKEISIDEMTDNHLINTYNMLIRNECISPSTHDFYMCCDGPTGEMAMVAFEREQRYILSLPVSKELDWIKEELECRGLNI